MFDAVMQRSGPNDIYPEREEVRPGKTDRWSAAIEGFFVSLFKPKHENYEWIVEAVDKLEDSMRELSDQGILDTSMELRPLLKREGFSKELVARSFALVREVARRCLSMPHFDVQLIGGYILLNGMVTEMETGEGKTLVATLPACTMALAGIPVHVITVNDYLASRDAEWMTPIYKALGISVGTVVHGKDPNERREAYRCDVTYCTNKEVAFDYLRDRIVIWERPSALRLKLEKLYGEKSRIPKLVMRGLHFAIIDEADSVLIDEAKTPLIISSQASGIYDERVYKGAMDIARSLLSSKDFTLSEGERILDLTSSGKTKIGRFDWPSLEVAISEGQKEQLVRQGLVALYLFKPDKQYMVKDDKVQIIDEYTGRVMADRSWEMGLHQLIEVKEGLEVTLPKQTLARISYQRFFRRYMRLAGMTGTAREIAGELWSVYRMRVVPVKPNRAVKRVYLRDRVYTTLDDKWKAVIENISQIHETGRPVLVGTRSVESSEHLSRLLEEEKIPHRVLNARQDKEEADIIKTAGEPGHITVATNMAGRGTDIRLGEGVYGLGGLHVIATERHESGRIDRQLFGRCGRQGDPGSCIAIISLEDELVTAHLPKLFQRIAPLAIEKRIFISDHAARWTFFVSQKLAERMHSRMRHNLLKMDDQMGESLAFSGRFE